MLLQLHVENFALVESLTLEFVPRLNILTGETGAGKSILIDALRFALGERSDQIRVRHKSKACVVEAVFQLDSKHLKADDALKAYLDAEDDVLILRRELQPEGKSRAWINNRVATVGTLKRVSAYLIDIHGQYDHQLLLDTASHKTLIDKLGQMDSLKAAYQEIYTQYDELLGKKEELRALQSGKEREADLLKYQIDEIEKVSPQTGEEEELKTERIRLANSEKLYETASHALGALDGEEVSVSGLLGTAYRDLQGLIKLDESLSETLGDYEESQLKLEEIIRTLRDYQESLSFDPDRLEEIDNRLSQLDLLKRKYGQNLEEVRAFYEEAKEKYDQIIHSDLYSGEIEKKIKALKPALKEEAVRMTEKRKRTATTLKKTIEQELKDLHIPNARFQCHISDMGFGPEGKDRLEFMISLNVGQDLMPLAKIISGGEVSRVMLAMKKALMRVDPVSSLIFDEIDANIGGRLGTVTGQKLKEIAAERQVLLVTHLPQIASFADRHIKVEKFVKNKETFARYHALEGEDKVQELAQMLSGLQETDISKKHAQEMLSRVSKTS